MNGQDKDFLVQKIRTQYTEKETSEPDALKELDARVKRPAKVFSYLFGAVGAIVMGAGMSLVITDIGDVLGNEYSVFIGILVGVIGMIGVSLAYPVYDLIIKKSAKGSPPI